VIDEIRNAVRGNQNRPAPHASKVMARESSPGLSVSTAATPTERSVMTSPAVRNDTQIGRAVSAAICEEIGDRLRRELAGESEPLPRYMAMLVEQMARRDRASAVLGGNGETAASRSNS